VSRSVVQIPGNSYTQRFRRPLDAAEVADRELVSVEGNLDLPGLVEKALCLAWT